MICVQRFIYQNICNFKCIPVQRLSRALITSSKLSTSYEGDGKTKVHIMNDDSELGLMINGYSQLGFRLNNDMTILGPMAIFPRTVLSWNVGSFRDINEDSLSLFTVLEPKLDILVLGTGDRTNDTTLFTTVIKFMRKYKVALLYRQRQLKQQRMTCYDRN
ncbi:uncharacterized protein CBL_06490 [Carabus blaptoides fortunei]